MCFPHPDKQNTIMQVMMFANPELLGLLNGCVDIYLFIRENLILQVLTHLIWYLQIKRILVNKLTSMTP